MTDQEKRDYYLRFKRFQQSREKLFAPKIYRALKEQYQSVIDNANLGINAIEQVNVAQLFPIIKELYIDAATVYGAKIRADLNREKARMPIGFSETMQQLIEDYFNTDILNTSLGISETTKELIRKVFTDAYSKGLGIDDIVKQLENSDLSRIRSRLIARTESVAAANQGALFVGKQTGLRMNKEWLSAVDNRTRRDHLQENGKVVGQDDYFNVGGYEMLAPGDKGGKDGHQRVPAKEVCNCRCTLILIPVRDNGKLVRV